MLPGIVLAAGDSTRMGSPKALLDAGDGHTFLGRILRTLAAAGLENLVVVTGRDHDGIVAALAADPPPVVPTVARNPDPSRGQLSSLWVGLDAVATPSVPGVLVTLVDVPFVAASTVQAVVSRWLETGAPIVRPAIGERHGHPVIFSRSVLDELRRAPVETGAKAVVHAHERELVNVAVEDEGCLVDIDTREEYRLLSGR